jgi:hypothetical protein
MSGVGHVVNPELTEYVGERYLFDSAVSPTGSRQAQTETFMCFVEYILFSMSDYAEVITPVAVRRPSDGSSN